MADVNRGNRPLSPHLQHLPPADDVSVVDHGPGISGLAVFWCSSLLAVWWLLAAATSESAFRLY